MYIFSEMTGIR